MAKLTTVYWRDIPAQVIAKERRETAKIVLTERFAEAIDRAAMRAQMAGTDAYLEQWRRDDGKCGPDLQAAVDAAGCSQQQFCALQTADGGPYGLIFPCLAADWRNDESTAFFPGDCRPTFGAGVRCGATLP